MASLSHISSLVRTLLPILLALVLLTAQSVGAETDVVDSNADFPVQFGKVVYRTDTGAPARIFIIANGHRSALSGQNGSKTLQSQIETYRIGEWLIRQEQVDLLLPEGFFGSWEKKTLPDASPRRFADTTVLEQRLTDTSTFVNAEILLHEAHGVGLEQVEDRALYLQTREQLHSELQDATLQTTAESDKLEYLQRLRTATILQKSVAALGPEPGRGALLTIGLSHLNHILSYLDAGKIKIPALQSGSAILPAVQSDLALSSAPVDISVIVPKALLGQTLLAQNARH